MSESKDGGNPGVEVRKKGIDLWTPKLDALSNEAVWRFGGMLYFKDGSVADHTTEWSSVTAADEKPSQLSQDFQEADAELRAGIEAKHPKGSELNVLALAGIEGKVDLLAEIAQKEHIKRRLLDKYRTHYTEQWKDADKEAYNDARRVLAELYDQSGFDPENFSVSVGDDARRILKEHPIGIVQVAQAETIARPGDSVMEQILTKHGDELLLYTNACHEYGMGWETSIASLKDAAGH